MYATTKYEKTLPASWFTINFVYFWHNSYTNLCCMAVRCGDSKKKNFRKNKLNFFENDTMFEQKYS